MIDACAASRRAADVRRGAVLRAEVRARARSWSTRAPSATSTMRPAVREALGPHADWFWDVDQSGGGVLMDMGCHAFGWFRWMLGGSPGVERVCAALCTVVHGGRTRGEDNAIAIVEFEGGAIGVAENSWAKPGGMDDRIEVYGTGGVSYADLFAGNAALTYSEAGLRLRASRRPARPRVDVHDVRGGVQQGYPQEMEHFIDCVRTGRTRS